MSSALVETGTAKPLYVCARCAASEHVVRSTEAPRENRSVDSMEAVLDHTGKITVRATRAPKNSNGVCRHVWITEDDLLNGRADEAKARATEAFAAAQQKKSDDEKKAAAHKTHDFRKASKNCMEREWLGIRVDAVWDIRNPPRYFGLKVNGSGMIKKGKARPKTFWPDLFPTHVSYTDMVDEFCRIMALAFDGFDAMAKHEFATTGSNPHTQMLISYPLNEDGTPKTVSFAKGSKYAEFNKANYDGLPLTFEMFAELLWGTLSGQKFNVADPICTWTAMDEEDIKPLATLQDHVERFIDYSRKDGRKYRTEAIGKKAKVTQNEFAVAWYGSGKRFSWWKTYGFKNLRQPDFSPIKLEARTPSAIAYLTDWARKHSGAEITVIEVDERDEWGIPTGNKVKKTVGMFTPGATQGGTIGNHVSDEDFTALRRMLSYYNTSKAVYEPEEELIATITVGPETEAGDMVEAEEYEYEQFKMTIQFIKELRDSAPAWWDRKGAEQYLMNMIREEMNQD